MSTKPLSAKDAPAAKDDDAAPIDLADGQWTPAQIAFMKKAIAAMSTILVIGFIVVIGRIFYLSNKSNPAEPVATMAVGVPQTSGNKASNRLASQVELALPSGARISHMAFSGRHIAIHYESPTGGGIAILDLISGKTVSRIKLSTQVPQ